MSGKLIITRYNNKILSAVFEDNRMITVNICEDSSKNILGNIYLGKVKNIVGNIGAAFVEIADKRVCYLHITPAEHPVFASEKKDGKLRVGDEIIVQVEKEDKSLKAPVLTANFSLTGKYVVLVHGRAMLGVSSKISSEPRRRELKALLKPHIEDTFGYVVRTNAEFADDRVIEKEAIKLADEYKSMLRFGVHWTVFSKLYSAAPKYLSDIRDAYCGELEEIKTDDKEIYEEICSFMKDEPQDEQDKVKLYTDETLSLDALFGIKTKLQKALDKKVWLDSGGFLVIEPTEALTAIDVNTGKAIAGKHNPEETFLRINLEAAKEIAAQIRLRNISGIIIVDFIDLKEADNREKLMKAFREELSKDHVPASLVDMTQLGLVEVTRKKVRKPLYEQI